MTEISVKNLAALNPDWYDSKIGTPKLEAIDLAETLAGALYSLLVQAEQMQGMFDDDDGAIQSAIDDANTALADYHNVRGGKA